MNKTVDSKPELLNIPLDRDVFLRTLVGHLAGTLEEVVGFEEASGFISIVGQHLGEWIGTEYREALGVPRLSKDHLAQVLVDLKRRIQGDFYIISQDDEKIVLGNRACPFGNAVKDRNSLCMMTSNVFGTITADNLGYAKVALHETIARGSSGCRIVIYLTESPESCSDVGKEYFGP